MEASPTQECQRTRSYLSHESNHPSTAIPEQQRSLAWRHSTRATCRSRTEVELGLEAPRCLQYQIYRVCRCRRPRSTRRRMDTSRCMEAWVGSRCSNSRGYAYQDMHVHQLHVEVITLSQFHIYVCPTCRAAAHRSHVITLSLLRQFHIVSVCPTTGTSSVWSGRPPLPCRDAENVFKSEAKPCGGADHPPPSGTASQQNAYTARHARTSTEHNCDHIVTVSYMYVPRVERPPTAPT